MGAQAEALPAGMDADRFAVTRRALEGPGKDLADLTDVEFEEGLKRLKVVQRRVQAILDTALVEGGHYGNPVDSRGNKAFKKPILYKAGAEELRRLMRYSLRRTRDDEIMMLAPSPENPEGFVSVVVEMAITDASGRVLDVKRAACTTKEKRFRSFDGKGWIYKDAREMVHVCVTMAEKRCGTLTTSAATGATAFLANGEEMDEALDEDKPITPWTEAEQARVREAAQKKGLGRRSFAELVHRTLGRADIGSGADVVNVLSAIERWQAPSASPGNGAAPPAKVPCEDCRGTGRDDGDAEGVCQPCMGTGKVRAPAPISDPRD